MIDPNEFESQHPSHRPTEYDQVDLEDNKHSPCSYVLLIICVLFFILTLPISIFFAFRTVKANERAIILRLGKILRRNGHAVIGAGIQFVLPIADRMTKVDMRTQNIDIPAQEVLTSDAVTVNVDAVVFLRIVEPASAILRVENARKSAELVAVSALRTIIGTYDLADLLRKRTELDRKLQQFMDDATDVWGIKVERVEITDVSLPQDMQRAMAAEAQATRAAKAKVIAAQGELDASETLRKAANEMAASPMALQLRYLQTLATIATEQNSTIVFPLPLELLSSFGLKKNN